MNLTVWAVVLGGLGGLAAFARWVWPPLRDFFRGIAGAIDNVNGRPERRDKANRLVSPAVPSLAVQLSDLRDAVKDQSEQNRRITAVEEKQAAEALIHAEHAKILAEHGRRLTDVEHLHAVERITSQAVQGKVVDAIAEANRRRDVIDGATDAEVIDE